MNNRSFINGFITVLLGLMIISCQPRNSSNETLKDKQENSSLARIDSIIFKTSGEEFIYLGERLYPNPRVPDSLIANQLVSTEVICVSEVGDTIFAFLNNELLYDRENKYFPLVNDSMFTLIYPEHYRITVDDDIPYFVYLENENDLITLIKDKKRNIYYWESATIQDTVVNFFYNIKVGMEKEEVFSRLKLPKINFNKSDFSMILCQAARPYKIWYKQIKFSKNQLDSFGKANLDFSTDKSTLQALLHFKNNKLELIYLDPWIGYGQKGEIRSKKINK
ncbi:MAG: hypothetical protein IPJ16_08770 [Bacteroidales bacterium]|nr:hypothetical protein [Bacteroidales bacterium]